MSAPFRPVTTCCNMPGPRRRLHHTYCNNVRTLSTCCHLLQQCQRPVDLLHSYTAILLPAPSHQGLHATILLPLSPHPPQRVSVPSPVGPHLLQHVSISDAFVLSSVACPLLFVACCSTHVASCQQSDAYCSTPVATCQRPTCYSTPYSLSSASCRLLLHTCRNRFLSLVVCRL